jgi:hypothetical protein
MLSDKVSTPIKCLQSPECHFAGLIRLSFRMKTNFASFVVLALSTSVHAFWRSTCVLNMLCVT